MSKSTPSVRSVYLSEVGEEYFVELRPRAPAAVPSNYSALFSVIAETLGDTSGCLRRSCHVLKTCNLIVSSLTY